MMNTTRRSGFHDDGFTLIELMVVVMIIAVLIAIAIPSFLGFRKSTQDRSAQSEVRRVLLAEKEFWLENGEYTQSAADISALEPSARVAAAAADGVYVDLSSTTSGVVCIVRRSESGATFSIWESSTAGTYYGATDLSTADCPADAPAGYSQDGF